MIYCQHRDEALDGADALAIVTEWKHFVHPDFDELRRPHAAAGDFRRSQSLLATRMKQAGFTYYSIGRPAV